VLREPEVFENFKDLGETSGEGKMYRVMRLPAWPTLAAKIRIRTPQADYRVEENSTKVKLSQALSDIAETRPADVTQRRPRHGAWLCLFSFTGRPYPKLPLFSKYK